MQIKNRYGIEGENEDNMNMKEDERERTKSE